jgi:putative membrane protein
MMRYYAYGPGCGYGYGMMNTIGELLHLIFWLIIIIIIIRFLRRRKGAEWNPFHSLGSGDRPIDVLKMRYAKGEINKDEFDEKKRDLES